MIGERTFSDPFLFVFADVNSWKSLDLIHMDLKPKKGNPNSLFEILNCCVTPGGTKTLKSYLLQPSANPKVINARLDVVQEFVVNQAVSLSDTIYQL